MTILEEAIIFATKAHEGIKRKGKERAYILHPIEAMTIVSTISEDEEVLAAAVLHDTVEDTDVTRDDIEKKFGKRVAELVASEREDKRKDQPPESTWITRKQETITHLQHADRDIKLICLGDKLANIREIRQDYAVLGDGLWERFNQKDKSLHRWYYSSVYLVLEEEFGDVPVIREYCRLLEEVFDWKEKCENQEDI